MLHIDIRRNPAPKAKPEDETKLGFGKYYTDHMFIMDYEEGTGWHDARIVPFENFSMTPAALVYHYGMCIFEGMKAYRRPDGGVQLFRPDENASRMKRSAERMCMPPFPEEYFLEAVQTLVALDADWVPSEPGTTLYIRPTLICNHDDLSMHALDRFMFFIILSPVGSYYTGGLQPVRIKVEEEASRCVRGGTGFAKCGGNYAGSFQATQQAAREGYSQVLWLDGATKQYVEEVGSNNIMFKIGGKIVTPALGDTVLPGITRKSSIEMLKGWGYEVEERLLPVAELMEHIEAGNVEEVFGVGTAAIITPVGTLGYKGRDYEFNGGKIGETTQRLYDELVGLQFGQRPDPHGWAVRVGE